MKTPIFPSVLHGGDYNPEQWPQAVREEDIKLMGEANWNVATLPVFGWATLQPDEDRFDFSWLDDILDRMAEAKIHACLATATASVPAWVTQKYPDVLTCDDMGVPRKHGNRHVFCPNSANFRRLSTNLARKLAERYQGHPALLLWHVSNEYGNYCWCPTCAATFRTWLQAKYGDLDGLNAAWYTSFWGHTYTDWAQIEPPYRNGEGAIQTMKIDWNRFQSESLLNCFKAEAAVLREVTPGVPITTNLMGTFFPLNYHEWAKELDIASWDSYPPQGSPPENVAFTHALMRGLKGGQPFMLMEQSPSQQNWQPYNTVKLPGELRRQSFQAMAHGADTVMYFQWRRGRGGIEKLHGAIVEHSNRTDVRVFQEVSALGADLKKLGTAPLGGRVPAKVALLFSWENWWGLSASSGPTKDLNYVGLCRDYFGAFWKLGIPVEVLSPDADLSGYDLIVAPTLSMLTTSQAEQLTARVQSGATLLASVFSGLTDESDLVHPGGPPGPLTDVLGLWVEETDAVMPGDGNGLDFGDGKTFGAGVLCDRIRLEGAKSVATYTSDFYAGEPAVTANSFGDGEAWYVAVQPDAAGIRHLLQTLCAKKGIASPLANGAPPPDGVEAQVRGELLYLMNYGDATAVPLAEGSWHDLLTGETFVGEAPLAVMGVRVLRQG